MIDNVLLQGETRAVKIDGKVFSRKIGWDQCVAHLLQRLKFGIQTDTSEPVIAMPVINDTVEGQETKKTLMRAWVELGIIAASYRSPTGSIDQPIRVDHTDGVR